MAIVAHRVADRARAHATCVGRAAATHLELVAERRFGDPHAQEKLDIGDLEHRRVDVVQQHRVAVAQCRVVDAFVVEFRVQKVDERRHLAARHTGRRVETCTHIEIELRLVHFVVACRVVVDECRTRPRVAGGAEKVGEALIECLRVRRAVEAHGVVESTAREQHVGLRLVGKHVARDARERGAGKPHADRVVGECVECELVARRAVVQHDGARRRVAAVAEDVFEQTQLADARVDGERKVQEMRSHDDIVGNVVAALEHGDGVQRVECGVFVVKAAAVDQIGARRRRAAHVGDVRLGECGHLGRGKRSEWHKAGQRVKRVALERVA